MFVGAAIFFEFKHYKPKKKFTSTKCFAFMEMDEIKPGPIVIELWVIKWSDSDLIDVMVCHSLYKLRVNPVKIVLKLCGYWTYSLMCDRDLRYKKPTDFKRKKLNLLTKKPLYLHLHQTLHKGWANTWATDNKEHHFSHLFVIWLKMDLLDHL